MQQRGAFYAGFFVALLSVLSYCLADEFNEFDINNPKSGKLRRELDYYTRPGTSAAELLRARGYIAREYWFKTKQGYILNIVRGNNPLINDGQRGLDHKDPILFVHGSISSGPIWLVNSKGARPQDFSRIDVNKLTLAELNQLIGHYDSARSMPMLALNFGYEVWIVNRRGFLGSERRAGHLDRPWFQVLKSIPSAFMAGNFTLTAGLLPMEGKRLQGPVNVTQLTQTSDLSERRELIEDFWQEIFSNLKATIDFPASLGGFGMLKKLISHTFDPEYWDFSLDEQAEFDFPQMIEFVRLKSNKRKVIVFTHSAATPISLMSLSIYPNLGHKISKLINWSSSVNMGTKTDTFGILAKLTPLLQSYIGPIPFAYTTLLLQSFLQNLCQKEVAQRTLCAWLLDSFFGDSKGQCPVTKFVTANVFQPTSSHEIMHMLQMTREDKPRKYNFNSAQENVRRYGREEPPEYDFGRIKVKNMVFYVGAADALSSPDMIKLTAAQLRVPYKIVLINGTNIHYNHGGAFLHDQTTRLTNLPSLMDIERHEKRADDFGMSYLLS